jgi:hypothetical protein
MIAGRDTPSFISGSSTVLELCAVTVTNMDSSMHATTLQGHKRQQTAYLNPFQDSCIIMNA